MNKYVFTATIYPKRVNFSLSRLSSRYNGLSISSPDWNVGGEFDIEIKDSKAIIVLKSEFDYSLKSEPNIETIKNILERSARLFIDTFCFIHSYNYDLIIDTVECEETGLKYTFPVIGEVGFTGNNENFTKYLDIILQKQANIFGDVFADFRRCIKYPEATANYCFRSLESIRRTYFDDLNIEDDNERDKTGWKMMAKELGVERSSTFDMMREFATSNRHGIYPKITWEQRKEIMTFTRKVIEKSLEWLKNN